MNKGIVLDTDLATNMAAVQVLGGPTVTAGCVGGVPGIGSQVWLQDLGNGAWLIMGQQAIGYPLPWHLPWGFIGQATRTSALTVGTTSQAVLSVTFTAVANRRYRYHLGGCQFHPAANTTCELQIQMDGGVINGAFASTTAADVPLATSGWSTGLSVGSHTLRLWYAFVAGGAAGNSVNVAASGGTMFLGVDDDGPNGDPAVV